ncbi:MAG: hypothetical protein PVI84_12445, partial [Syntrophobacterales bacterium]
TGRGNCLRSRLAATSRSILKISTGLFTHGCSGALKRFDLAASGQLDLPNNCKITTVRHQSIASTVPADYLQTAKAETQLCE